MGNLHTTTRVFPPYLEIVLGANAYDVFPKFFKVALFAVFVYP